MGDNLGDLDVLILTSVMSLGHNAYGMTVHEQVEKLAERIRSVSLGSVYTVLDRLEQKGYAKSWFSDPTVADQNVFFEIMGTGELAMKNSMKLAGNVLAGLREIGGGMSIILLRILICLMLFVPTANWSANNRWIAQGIEFDRENFDVRLIAVDGDVFSRLNKYKKLRVLDTPIHKWAHPIPPDKNIDWEFALAIASVCGCFKLVRNRRAGSRSIRESITGITMNSEFLFYLFLDAKNCDALVGDLEESYKLIYRKFGQRRANFWYWTQAIRSVGPIAWAWGKKAALKPVVGVIAWGVARGLVGHDSWLAALMEIWKRIRL